MRGHLPGDGIGLGRIRPGYRPPVRVSSTSFRLMVALGMFFIVLPLFASWRRWRGTLFNSRWLLWVFVFAVLGAFAANELGWVAAEVGRQPWIVHPNVVRDASGGPVFDSDVFFCDRLVSRS